MYHLVLPNDLKQAAEIEKRRNKNARTSISFQKRTLPTSRGTADTERSILGTTVDGFDTLTGLRSDDIAQETCFSDDASTIVSQKTEEQFDFYPSWSERDEKRWYHRNAPRGTWETTLFDRSTEAPYSYSQELLLRRLSSDKEMASKSSKSRHPTYISSVLRNGDGSRRISVCDMAAKKYSNRKSRLVTAQEKNEHFATRVCSPENVVKSEGSLMINSPESTSYVVASQESAAVIKQDPQKKPVSEGPTADLHISEIKKCDNSTSGQNLEASECNKPSTKAHQSEIDELYLAKLSIQRAPVYNQPNAFGTLPLKTEIEESVYQKRCSTAENMSDHVPYEVEQANSKLQPNEEGLGVLDPLDILIRGDGDDRLAAAIQNDCGDKTIPLEDQDADHLGDLHTNFLISQAVQMNPVKMETNEKQSQTMRKTESTLTVASLRVSMDSNTTLHSDTSSPVFPTEEDIQKQDFQTQAMCCLSSESYFSSAVHKTPSIKT